VPFRGSGVVCRNNRGFIGDRLGIDLYYVALLAFGFRMFKNLAMLRRYLLRDYRGGGHKSMLRNP